MGEVSQNCIKWLMFGFNLIFSISGIALIAAGAVAQSHYSEVSIYLDSDSLTVSAPVLLILVGVFIFAIAFLGCCGAARDNYYMLMGFSILLGLIFILQMAGGIAGYVQKGAIIESGTRVLNYTFMPNYFNNTEYTNKTYRVTMDALQEKWQCCGSNDYRDWYPIVNRATNQTGVVASCCKTTDCTPTELMRPYLDANCTKFDNSNDASCKIYTKGCAAPIESLVGIALVGVAGAAIGLAFIQIIGIVFACYLAKRIRSGYVYA